MRNEIMGASLLFILSLYSAVSVSWYSPSADLPAAMFAVFPMIGALGVIVLTHRKRAV